MITVYTALYPEAQPLIAAFSLRKDTSEQSSYQVFLDTEGKLRLVVTGTGLSAALAVAVDAAKHPPKDGDLMVNYGSCASPDAVGTVFCCHKLTDAATGRTFYPDMLVRHPFPETALVTYPRVQTAVTAAADMEAALVYQAGSLFYAPDEMFFVKVVTDHGERLTAEAFAETMREAAKSVFPFLKQLSAGEKDTEDEKRQRTLAEADRISEALHASESMRQRLCQLAIYGELTGRSLESEQLFAKDKREGKKILEKLERKWCQL